MTHLAAMVLTVLFATSALATEYDIAAFGIGAPSGIIGSDGRRTATAESWPFVVRIYNERGFLCNGFVVGRRLILTAAHCVQLPRNQWRTPYYAPRWVSTWKNTRYKVDKVIIAPDYGEHRADELESVSDDVAFISTTKDLIHETGKIDIMDSKTLNDRTSVVLVGYSPKFGEQLKKQSCRAAVYETIFSSDRIQFQCDTEPGSSGSPVVVRVGNTYRVVGVLSGGSQQAGQNYAALLDKDGHPNTFSFVKRVVRQSRPSVSSSRRVPTSGSHRM